jgi:hypothetical protein
MANPPTTPTITVRQLRELTGDGIVTTYKKLKTGIFPSIRLGRQGRIAVLTEPTMAILRGERLPGRVQPAKAMNKRQRTATRSTVNKRAAKAQPVARKGDAPTLVPS